MNWKRFIAAVAAAYVFMFLYEWVVHGMLLMDAYMQTPDVWRTPEEMQSFFPLSVVLGLLFTAVLCWIFTRNYEDKGIGEGVRFGLAIGLLFGIFMLSWYVILPISITVGVAWFVAALVEFTVVGVIFALLYKEESGLAAQVTNPDL